MNFTWTAPIEENDLWLLLIICGVTVKWETAKAGIFRITTWKWHQNEEKICSGNPTFFRSITWNPLYLFSISWHYPFKSVHKIMKERYVLPIFLREKADISDSGCGGVNYLRRIKETLTSDFPSPVTLWFSPWTPFWIWPWFAVVFFSTLPPRCGPTRRIEYRIHHPVDSRIL